jgi:hypothetical protein
MEEMPLVTATNASPMALPSLPTPISRKFAAVVPYLLIICAFNGMIMIKQKINILCRIFII